MKNLTFPFLILGLFCMSVLCGSKISVISPQQLAAQFDKTNGISFALANYGKIPYGAHFVGGLALADPIDACEFMDHFSAGEMQFDHNIIAIVRKGKCLPAIKTKNAQNAGAKMVIIVQDTDEASPQAIAVGSDTEGITIPTIVIPKKEGERLIKFIEKLPFPPLNPDDIIPIISVNFPYDAMSNTVALDLFYSSADAEVSNEFINSFAPFILESNGAFKFTPHFVTWDCQICKQLDYQVPLTGDCISGGRYCAPDPDNEGPLSGKDILYEDLRQACMWKTDELLWWSYMAFYPNGCLNSDTSEQKLDAETCSRNQLNMITSDDEIAKINECVKNSFFKADKNNKNPADPTIDDNSILSEQRKLQLEYDITIFPVLLINHKPYDVNDGNLTDTVSVLREVCRNVRNPPLICRDVGVGYATSKFGIFMSVVTVLCIAAFVVFFCYRKLTSRDFGIELSTQANQMVSQYMALKDAKPMIKDEEEIEVK